MLRYTGWISLGPDALIGCVIADISDSGARLKVEQPSDVPDEFLLLLSARGKPRRCYVVWRTSDQIGCQFDRPMGAKEKTPSILKAEEMTPPLPLPGEDVEAGETASGAKEPA